MTYEDVSNEAELAVIEHLYDIASEMTMVIGNGAESDSIGEALLLLVESKLVYNRKKLKVSEGMN